MHIVFVTSEIIPYSRTGGLADVSYHLSKTLAEMGHKVTVITPLYRQVKKYAHDFTYWGTDKLSLADRTHVATYYYTQLNKSNHQIIFIACDDLFDRPELYGNEFGDYADNAERFIFFSRATMKVINKLESKPDIVHCHDWTTGLVPLYIKYSKDHQFDNTATVMTFHNLRNQGIFWHYDFPMTGLDWEFFTPDELEFHGQMNLIKAGLISANAITTVSCKYSQEATTPEQAKGLEGVLIMREDDIYPILNGVDYSIWNPATDNLIAARYSADNMEPKKKCQQDLKEIFSLENAHWPLLAVISRLLDRKGFDLIKQAIPDLLSQEMNLIIMGAGDDHHQMFATDLSQQYKGRIATKIGYDNELAHKIIAGSDIFLMPSRFEPCGLEQMYALKYGTVPVVRATGGLDDTIIDALSDPENGNGFKFQHYNSKALVHTLNSAIKNFADKDFWKKLMYRGMKSNFSWNLAAKQYDRVYHIALDNKKAQIK